jgi:16S rRNA (cytosine1402-N4)-methyltransferase
MATVHVPILVSPIIDGLLDFSDRLELKNFLISKKGLILDCTLGGGGHTSHFLSRIRDQNLPLVVLGLDQDESAVLRGRERFSKEIESGSMRIERCQFSDAFLAIERAGWSDLPLVGVLADLGFSSDQLESAERGLSFLKEGPLDMRLDPENGVSAWELIQATRESDLADLIYEFGEERHSRRIARWIKEALSRNELENSTLALANLVRKSVLRSDPRASKSPIHPATRTFQAIRIAVNQELDQLDSLLGRVILKLIPGGRVAILSFHSLEDRRVKQAFLGEAFRPLTKKPAVADDTEVASNPRSRSAKLRIAQKL